MTGCDCQTRAADDAEALEQVLEQQLITHYGPMISNDSLRQVLGYSSMDAFRQALARQTVPVPVFGLANRRGKYALALDIAQWMAAQRNAAKNESSSRGSGSGEGGTPPTG